MKKLSALFLILSLSILNFHSARGDTTDSMTGRVDYVNTVDPIVVTVDSVVQAPTVIEDTTYMKGDSVIHVSENNTPPLMYRELPTKTGGTVGTFFWSLIGLLIYFFFKYQEKKGRDASAGTPEKFDFGLWIKDNLITLILYTIGFAFLFWNAGSMHPIAAIAIGMSPAVVIDALKKRFGSTT